MYERFTALAVEKQNRILNAAMEEFGAKGYQKASTNAITKQAGISKGALFHYFSSKQALFEYLYSHNLQLFLEQLLPRLQELPRDVMEKWSAFALMKMEIAGRYPLIFEFMLSASKDKDSGVQRFLAGLQTDFAKEFATLIHGDIDTRKFKDGLDVPKALDILWWTLEGFARKTQAETSVQTLQDPRFTQRCLEDMNRYLALLKHAFYKEEFLP